VVVEVRVSDEGAKIVGRSEEGSRLAFARVQVP
jgi:hypothetical protein